MQLLQALRSRMYISAVLGAMVRLIVLVQPDGAQTAGIQPYLVWLFDAIGRDQGVKSDGDAARGCKKQLAAQTFLMLVKLRGNFPSKSENSCYLLQRPPHKLGGVSSREDQQQHARNQ